MKKILLASGIALALSAGIAAAQTTTTYSTTTVTPAPVPAAPVLQPPPDQTLAVERTQRALTTDGTQIERTETTYRNPQGIAQQSEMRTTAPPQVVTTTTTTRTATTVIEQPPMPHSCPPHNHYDARTEACVFN